MNKLIAPVKPLAWEDFKDLDALSPADCRGSIQYLEYLLAKENKSYLQEKYRYYIGKLNHRLTQLKGKEQPL